MPAGDARKNRAGQYHPQPGGYQAFLPTPLPPDPPVAIEGQLQALLSQADRALGRLDGAIGTLPASDFIMLMYVRKEAVLSSQIEGAQSSLDDVLSAEAKVLDPDRPKDVEEVLNYIAAMRLGLRRLAELPVSVRLIREIHARLLRGVRGGARAPGEFRRVQNWIGPEGGTIHEATFVPPPQGRIADDMARLETFLHSADQLPVLVRIGLAHAQFETIHPFLDGNGRLGRLLVTFLLCEGKVLHEPVLYLSHYFRKHRSDYYDRLQSVREDGDWEGWLRFFLQGVCEVANEATTITRTIASLRERHRTLVIERFGRAAGAGLRVLEKLYSLPVTTVNKVKSITKTSYQSANGLVARFVDLGILDETTGHARNRRFRYSEYINLFSKG